MPLASNGAVLLLEIRPDPRVRTVVPIDVDARLAEARVLLEAVEPGRSWTAAGGPAFAGRMVFDDAAQAFPFVYGLRTTMRADPSKPPLVVLAGLGRGEENAADRLAAEAFRAHSKRRNSWTAALTGQPRGSRVLSALCRTIDTIERGWTDAQWEAIFRRDRNVTLQQIGDDLGIAYQNVSKRLIAAKYALHREILDAASLVFSTPPPEFA
jgi:hypothetical protein